MNLRRDRSGLKINRVPRTSSHSLRSFLSNAADSASIPGEGSEGACLAGGIIGKKTIIAMAFATPCARGVLRGLLAGVLLAAGQLPTAAPNATAQPLLEPVRIEGQLTGAPQGARLEEAKVSLEKFTLDEQGRAQRSPVKAVQADSAGRYSITGFAVESKTLYRVTASLGSSSAGSKMFSIPPGQTALTVDLAFPRVAQDTSQMRIQEGVVVLEARRGALLITEIVHFSNPANQIVDTGRTPLEFSLPPGAEQLEMLRPRALDRKHEQMGEKLLIFQNLPPGRSSVAFRYLLPAAWGGVTLSKRYPFAVKQVSLLTPSGGLNIDGARLKKNPDRTIDKVNYRIWTTSEIPAGGAVLISAAGVPIHQQLLLIWVGVFLALMAGLVAWFWRTRLPDVPRMPSEDPP